jgi:hypothetical protein
LKAEAEDELYRANHIKVTAVSGENKPVRHSSAGGINLQVEWRQSAALFHRPVAALGQRMATKSHRPVDAVALGDERSIWEQRYTTSAVDPPRTHQGVAVLFIAMECFPSEIE